MQKMIRNCGKWLFADLPKIKCNSILGRYLHGKKPFNWEGEGIQYHGFKYYPRYPDQKDEPYEPSKLFRVQRIKPVKGTPFWERKILNEFKLNGRASDVAILKNIPETNSRLYRIKHLIKITPITFPNGFPESIDSTFLKENGELIVTKHLKVDDENRMDAIDKFKNDPKRLDGDTLRRDSRKKWLSGW